MRRNQPLNTKPQADAESTTKQTPAVVYACSGCSNVAQLANDVAVHLHRSGEATMSCIAGVGGNVKPLLKQMENADRIIAIDGCQLHCVAECLQNHGVQADHHVRLYELGYRKRTQACADDTQFETVLTQVRSLLPA